MALGKLSKAERDQIDTLHAVITDAYSELVNSVVDYNEQAATLHEELVQPARQALEDAQEALRSALEDIASEQRSLWDEKSEKWQEGDRAQAISDWIDGYENVCFPDIPELDPPLLDENEIEDPEDLIADLSSEVEE
jgi:uncharacterized protein YdiU (UPF0061 family)